VGPLLVFAPDLGFEYCRSLERPKLQNAPTTGQLNRQDRQRGHHPTKEIIMSKFLTSLAIGAMLSSPAFALAAAPKAKAAATADEKAKEKKGKKGDKKGEKKGEEKKEGGEEKKGDGE
jgi:hypothetical protein